MHMNAIKSIRTRLGLTQAALAEAIGCTQGNVGHYENKGQTVPPEVARRLIAHAASLGVPLSFDDVYGPPPQPSQATMASAAGQGV